MGKKIDKKTISIREQSGADRTLFATWSFSHAHLDSFSYEWQYQVDGVWFEGSSGSSSKNVLNCTYSVPSNGNKARIHIKPIAKKHKVNGKQQAYFSGSWSSWVEHEMSSSEAKTPETPSGVEASITSYTLVAAINNYTDKKANGILFEIVRNELTKVASLHAQLMNGHASTVFKVDAGNNYKVRARAYRTTTTRVATKKTYGTEIDDNGVVVKRGTTVTTYENKTSTENSEWTPYCQILYAPPGGLRSRPVVTALSATELEVRWDPVPGADSYEVEYTTDPKYFDASPDAVSSGSPEGASTVYIIQNVGQDVDHEYYVRVRVVRGENKSVWSDIVSRVVGKRPNPPTTWSSTTTESVGNAIYLYWTHNSADNSRETEANIELTYDGSSPEEPINVKNELERDEDTGTYSYKLETSQFSAGARIFWKVQTRGAIDEFSEWSVQRQIDIYEPPTLSMQFGSQVKWHWDRLDLNNGVISETYGDIASLTDDVLEAFPLYVNLLATPRNQTPVAYYITIIALDTYDDVDDTGQTVHVGAGDVVFAKYYDRQEHEFFTQFTASDINLENGHNYRVMATVAMDSGLSADTYGEFSVDWDDDEFDIDGRISIDWDTISAFIQPFCEDENEELIDGITMAVYRRDFDGSFTEIATGLDNMQQITVCDPHPALNYARYRLVGKSSRTGKIVFYDMPAEPIGETAIILQWDEEWSNFDYNGETEDAFAEQPWSGSFLRLPWNVDIQDQNSIDASMSEYVGRKHPVSYYGTQVGQTSSWRCDIEKEDEETLYALRRLSVYMGDVYVREPSGSGYWAQVNVSYSRNHNSMVIPVSLSVTRVEGGM